MFIVPFHHNRNEIGSKYFCLLRFLFLHHLLHGIHQQIRRIADIQLSQSLGIIIQHLRLSEIANVLLRLGNAKISLQLLLQFQHSLATEHDDWSGLTLMKNLTSCGWYAIHSIWLALSLHLSNPTCPAASVHPASTPRMTNGPLLTPWAFSNLHSISSWIAWVC